MKIKTYQLLFVVILLGFFLRIFFLNISPPGFNADEAAFGYNAYSILKTGKDEWGNTLPIMFKSFGEYKTPLYAYLSIPFIAIFGLNVFSVRLLSIIVGTLSIWLIFFLAKQIFKKDSIALSCAFILAISPWAIQYSRASWETNLSTFFTLLGVVLFLRGFKKLKLLLLSALSLILSIYSYRAAWVGVPLLIIFLIILYRKKIPLKRVVIFCSTIIILSTPLLFAIKQGELSRFNGISIFSDPGVRTRENQKRADLSYGIVGKPFYNSFTAYTGSFLEHYLDHFNPNFLFISGDPISRNNSVDTGELYLFEIVTIAVGMYILVRSKIDDKAVLLGWLVIAPIASGLTFQTPNAIRAESMTIPLSIISGFGLYSFNDLLPQLKRLRVFFRFTLCLVVLISLTHFLVAYFIELPKQSALEWEYGFTQVADFINTYGYKYQKIVITRRYDQPYMMLLFYSKFDPANYQKVTKTLGDSEFGFINIESFGKYQFKNIVASDFNQRNALIVGTAKEVSGGSNIVKTVKFPNGQDAFVFVETK